jgi:hypothetical protein
MGLRKEEIRKIEETFKEVYRKAQDVPVGAAWEGNVMRAIRRIGALPSRESDDFEGFGHLVWRLTAAAGFFALLLMVYAVISETGTASEITRLFFEDPLAVDLVHSLGIV